MLATRAGLFGLAVVLTSLYPGVTVLLARLVLGERMGWPRRAGLALAAAGILLVTRDRPVQRRAMGRIRAGSCGRTFLWRSSGRRNPGEGDSAGA